MPSSTPLLAARAHLAPLAAAALLAAPWPVHADERPTPEICLAAGAASGRLGRPLWEARGCTALDVIQTPEALLDEPREVLEEMLRDIDAVASQDPDVGPEAARFRDGNADVLGDIDVALDRLPDGEICDGAQALADAVAILGRLDDLAAERLARLARSSSPPKAGDAPESWAVSAAVTRLRGEFADARAELATLATVVDRLCAATARPVGVRGRVAKISDALRRLRLTDGRLFGLTTRGYRGRLFAGADVDMQVYDLGDGTGFTDEASTGAEPSFDPVPDPAECIDVRVAPTQPFDPPYADGGFPPATFGRTGMTSYPQGSEPYVLHEIEAYTNDVFEKPIVILEQGMRFAAVKRPCATDLTDDEFVYHRYYLTLTMTDTGKVMANQLSPGMKPVPGPDGLMKKGPRELLVDYYRQTCTLQIQATPWVSSVDDGEIGACDVAGDLCACDPAAGSCPVYPQWEDLTDYVTPYGCETPDYLGHHTFEFFVVERGNVCIADYESLLFDLEDHLANEFRTGEVSSFLTGLDSIDGDFFADGFTPASPGWVAPGTYETQRIPVWQGAPFGVFSWEPCLATFPGTTTLRNDCPFPGGKTALRAGGITTASALRWPRIVGYHDGSEYAYSCTLPPIVRDVVTFCPGKESYYRWPFEFATPIGQGNCHCQCAVCGDDSCCTHACGCKQEFAFDASADEGTPVYAMRGGKVTAVQENATENCWNKDCSQNPGGDWGNYITIEHQDGTASSYLHMIPGGPLVAKGDVVERGDLIGKSGNTGNSSGPHMHFQEQVSKDSGQTQVMKFEVLEDEVYLDCYTPVDGDNISGYLVPPPG